MTTASVHSVPLAPPARTSFGLVRRILTSRAVRGGLIMMIAVAAVALIGPFVAPHGVSEILGSPYAAPSGEAWLGTDNLGRDVLSRVLFGGRSLIVMSLLAAVIGTAVGAILGVTAAYAGGVVDTVLMRIADVLLAFPAVVLALLVVSMLGSSEALLVALVATAHVASVARVMRGAALPVANRDFVRWSQSIGLPARRIIFGDVFPNVASPLMVEFGLRLMWSVGALASLSFLGYGVQPPAADWGLMVNENRNGLSVQPLTVIVPIVGIALFTVGGNLFAEGVARVMGRTDAEATR